MRKTIFEIFRVIVVLVLVPVVLSMFAAGFIAQNVIAAFRGGWQKAEEFLV